MKHTKQIAMFSAAVLGLQTSLITAFAADSKNLLDFLLTRSNPLFDAASCDLDDNGILNAVDLALMLKSAPATTDDEWNLIWSDEFDGNAVDTSKWGYETGNWLLNENGGLESYGWGNNEKEFYTDKNATVSNGILTIAAKKEPYTDEVQGYYDYTSARMVTKNRFSTCGGRVEVRARVDSGKSLWPAIWMLPEDTVYGKWAASGEIDIMEGWGSTPDKICGTIHFGDTWPDNTYLTKDFYFTDSDSTENWHTYAIEWDAAAIRWFVDETCYSTQTDWYSAGRAYPAPFDQNFYLLLNLAIGGNFDGVNGTDADASIFANGDKCMQVDYVRVYKKNGYEFNPTELQTPSLTGYFEGADASLKNSDAGTTLTINSVGTLEYAAMAIYGKQPVETDKTYRLSFDCKSSTARTMRLTIEDSSYQRYLDELVNISPDSTHFSYDVTFPNAMNADIKFQLGCTEGADSLPAHTVQITALEWNTLS